MSSFLHQMSFVRFDMDHSCQFLTEMVPYYDIVVSVTCYAHTRAELSLLDEREGIGHGCFVVSFLEHWRWRQKSVSHEPGSRLQFLVLEICDSVGMVLIGHCLQSAFTSHSISDYWRLVQWRVCFRCLHTGSSVEILVKWVDCLHWH